jgi:hypothetical protein
MSTPGAADEWDFTVPSDDDELLAELRRHGVRPGRRVHVALVAEVPGRRSARGLLVGKVAPDELLSEEDFDAVHRANIEAASARYGSLDL